MNLDEIIKKLCPGPNGSFSIRWNDEASVNRATVREWLAADLNDTYNEKDFISPEEKQKCIDTNSLWTVQWYPANPTSFYLIHAATFEAIMKELEEEVATDE